VNETQIKGYIFEELIKQHLSKQGYEIIPDNIMNYYGVEKRYNGLNVKGRGAWHQIDALGQFQFQIPFIYPVRLISEAKCYRRDRKIGLPIIRNFVGVLKDISENYFVDAYSELEYKDRFRFTDCGVIFSTSEFTKDAQMYAYAQGIYLVQIDRLIDDVNWEYQRFIDLGISFEEYIENGFRTVEMFKFSYFGLASGFYPIAIVSDNKMPLNRFSETDDANIRIYYDYDEEINRDETIRRIKTFRIEFDNWRGYFQLPEYILEKYIEMRNFKNGMLDMKEERLRSIDIPMKINGIRRIIRLNLDQSWIDLIREKIRRTRHA